MRFEVAGESTLFGESVRAALEGWAPLREPELGAWHDVAWLELRLREDREKPAGPPRPMAELVTQPAWHEALRDGLARLR